MLSVCVHLGLGALVQPPSLAPHASRSATYARSAPFASAADDVDRRGFVGQSTAAAVGTAALAHASPARADFFGGDEKPQWKQVDLPIATESPILFDIEFDPQNPKNGWIVGNKGTFLQTTDGGATWVARSFSNLDPDEEINYRFTKLSFLNGEGWIIGKPAILLHTTDSGGSWERVPLSPKLPGDPYGIVALGRGKAELSTSAGAIYTTENAGRNWKAEVRETIDATLNRVSSSGVQGASYFSGSINSVRNSAQFGAIRRNSAQLCAIFSDASRPPIDRWSATRRARISRSRAAATSTSRSSRATSSGCRTTARRRGASRRWASSRTSSPRGCGCRRRAASSPRRRGRSTPT